MNQFTPKFKLIICISCFRIGARTCTIFYFKRIYTGYNFGHACRSTIFFDFLVTYLFKNAKLKTVYVQKTIFPVNRDD